MPIYEYKCEKCGHQFDALQKISADALTDCPNCGQPSLQKLISAPAFQLKGNGWYETDFKTKKQSSDTSGNSKDTDSSDAQPSTAASDQSAHADASSSTKTTGGSDDKAAKKTTKTGSNE